MKRVFIGLALPASVKDTLVHWQEKSKGSFIKARAIKRENLHLTLLFLGNTEDTALPGIFHAMDTVASKYPSFPAVTDAIGRFSGKRIIWARLSPEETLAALHRALSAALSRPAEDFASHITLFRDARETGRPLPPLSPVSFRVDSLTLFESRQSKSGVVYTPLHVVSLR